MVKISAVIITYNEEQNIKKCLDSLRDVADEIVILDSFSEDRTEEICSHYPVKFVKHLFEGHIEQKNYAVKLAKYPFILSLDADELLTPELKKSILKVKQNWSHHAYSFNRLNNYCGQWIRFGAWYPDRKLRLWDRRKGVWGGINPHDKVIMEPDVNICFLKGDLLHYSYLSIQEHIASVNKYSEISAKSFFEKNIRINILQILGHSIWRFFRDYIILLGFLDGFYGLVISYNQAFETFLKYVKLRELHRAQKVKLKEVQQMVIKTVTTYGQD